MQPTRSPAHPPLAPATRTLPEAPLRITLCTFSWGVNNGIARMDSLLLTGLREAGHHVTLIVIGCEPDVGTKPESVVFLSLDEALLVLPRLLAHSDLVQFNGSFDPLVTRAAVEAGVPTIIEVMHNTEQGGMFAEIDHTVCVSSVVRQHQTGNAVSVIHNGVNATRFRYLPGRRDVAGARILQIANTYKSFHVPFHEMATELVALAPETRFLLAGGRCAPALPYLRDVGVVSDPQPLYAAADILFLPSVHDAFGLVLAEAMACGCLAMGNRHTGAADLIVHGETGWLMENDKAAMLEALREAVATLGTPRHLHMQQAARQRIETLFSEQRCLEGYLNLYSTRGRRQRQRRVFSCPAWQPVLLAVHTAPQSLEKAVGYLVQFVSCNRPLEPHLLKHPNARGALAALLRLATLLADNGDRKLAQACYTLLQNSNISCSQLDEPKGQICT